MQLLCVQCFGIFADTVDNAAHDLAQGLTVDQQRTGSQFCMSGSRKLRSADAAFELLESFKSIQSRGAIRKQMMNKMNDILQQFRREIDSTTAIFHTLKVRPPLGPESLRWSCLGLYCGCLIARY